MLRTCILSVFCTCVSCPLCAHVHIGREFCTAVRFICMSHGCIDFAFEVGFYVTLGHRAARLPRPGRSSSRRLDSVRLPLCLLLVCPPSTDTAAEASSPARLTHSGPPATGWALSFPCMLESPLCLSGPLSQTGHQGCLCCSGSVWSDLRSWSPWSLARMQGRCWRWAASP